MNLDSLRSLSEIFTPSNFNRVVRFNDFSTTEKKLKKHYYDEVINKNYKKVLSELYVLLQNEYRNEYLYKNGLLNQYLLKKYSLSTTSVFSEFKIGNSIADFVLLNGNAKVFEIKTDLDSLDKLEKQINDYVQFADLVYIVTSSKHLQKIISDYSNSTIGVIEFTRRNTFKEHKKAESNKNTFCHSVLFKTLRKTEYLEIIDEYFEFIPNIPNTKIFKVCLEMLSEIDVSEFQKMTFNQLKKRKIKCPNLLESKKTPVELKQICYSLDFSKEEYNYLFSFLNKTI